jgi:hypothetical protein
MHFVAGPTLLVIDELGHLPRPTEAPSVCSNSSTSANRKRQSRSPRTGRLAPESSPTNVAAATLDRLLHRFVIGSPASRVSSGSYRCLLICYLDRARPVTAATANVVLAKKMTHQTVRGQ